MISMSRPIYMQTTDQLIKMKPNIPAAAKPALPSLAVCDIALCTAQSFIEQTF